jgi:hypothetical protein
MKRKIKILTIIFLLISSVCFAFEVNIEMTNNTDKLQIVRVKWVDHPFGCYVFAGILQCDYYLAVGEVDTGDTWNYTIKNKKKMCVYWEEKVHYGEKQNKTEFCFEINENMKNIISTPLKIKIEERE